MARFIEGVSRSQSTLFPERLDDFIGNDNPVRVIDAFVDQLDLLRGDGASRVSSLGSSEALYLRLSQPGAVEPAA